MENSNIQLRLASYSCHKDEKGCDYLVQNYVSDSGVVNVMYIPTIDLAKELESKKTAVYSQLAEIGKQRDLFNLREKELQENLRQLNELEKAHVKDVQSKVSEIPEKLTKH